MCKNKYICDYCYSSDKTLFEVEIHNENMFYSCSRNKNLCTKCIINELKNQKYTIKKEIKNKAFLKGGM